MVRQYSLDTTRTDRADLEAVVVALNRVLPDQLSDEDHKALVDYVELWNRSGRAPWKEPFCSATEGCPFKRTPPFKGAFEQHPFTEEIIKDADGQRFWQRHGTRFSRQNLERAFDWRIAATRARGCWYKAYRVTPDGAPDPAVLLAAMLLGNTLSAKLSDAPCQRCKKWFIARRAGQKCCAKRCAIAVNNTIRVSERRAAEHEERLGRARAALKAWRRTARRTDWKQFVSKQTELTPRFLQRAVTKGELRAPKISKEQDKKRRQK